MSKWCGTPGCLRPAIFRLTLEILDSTPTTKTQYLACATCVVGWLAAGGQTLEDAARVGNAALWSAQPATPDTETR